MTERTKNLSQKTKLPCHWVDEEGFTVSPIQQPSAEPRGGTDTAFVLKPKQSPRPTRFPSR